MQIPLQVTFRHLPHSDALEARIREKAAKLEQFFPHVTSCRVVVEEERLHQHQGKLFNVRIDLHIPGHELVVNMERNEDPFVAVRDAFRDARRQLEEGARVMRGDVKTHPLAQHGRVARLSIDEGCGFIETPDGRELYFSRENVVSPAFEQLEEGTEVQFLEELAGEGPQAKRVSAGKHHVLS
jgi:ribosomal subunit interface protein